MRSIRPILLAGLAALCSDASVAEEGTKVMLGKFSEYRVRMRPRPEYDAQGMRFPGWLIMPTLTSGLYYDSNIYQEQNNMQGSLVGLISPAIAVNSDFSRHSLNLYLSARERYVFEDANASTLSGRALADGRVDVLNDLALNLGGRIELNQDELGDNDVPLTSKTGVRYNVYGGYAGASKTFNRVTVGATGSISHYDYHDVESVDGDVLDQDNRDGYRYDLIAKVSYAYFPGLSFYGSAEFNERNWRDTGSSNRDSNGIELLAGMEFDMRGTIHGSAGVGYLSQDYELETRQDIQTFAYNVELQWTPTALVTVNIIGLQSIEESYVFGSAGQLESYAEIAVDYEFLRNWIFSPAFIYSREDYLGVNRVDNRYRALVKTDYFVNRYMKLGAAYEYERLSSDRPGVSYDRHLLGVNFNAEY